MNVDLNGDLEARPMRALNFMADEERVLGAKLLAGDTEFNERERSALELMGFRLLHLNNRDDRRAYAKNKKYRTLAASWFGVRP